MQTFVALAVPFVDSSSAKLIDIVNIEKITGGPSLIKTYQLLSVSSQRRVQMKFKKHIDAKGQEQSPYTFLNFQSDSKGSGWIRITGGPNKDYLCFSRKGKIITRIHGDNVLCAFKEEPRRNYIMLQSVANSKWYVGFKKNGRRMKGYDYSKDRWKKEKSFMFIKTEWNPDFKLGDKSQYEKFVNSDSHSIKHGYHGNR